MRRAIQLAVLAAFIGSTAYAQGGQTQYAGQEKREIKSLSAEEIQAYESGQGMGFAKVAELNQYPGPKHVLDFASELNLTDAQRLETRKIYDRMHAEAVRLGNSIVSLERDLDRLFATKLVDAPKLKLAVSEIARLQGEVRNVHLQAHIEMRKLLTGDQIKKYDSLRGYDSGDADHKDRKREH
ncbi:MAG TPA: Spy/CpxP family protein refolding chaperone [Blastocatellia bacterium]|nr:Spy/CpxP family protein refolding chaperone [Blastocatellia bacterium]